MEMKKLVLPIKSKCDLKSGTKAKALLEIWSVANVPEFWTISSNSFKELLRMNGIEDVSCFFENEYSDMYYNMIENAIASVELNFPFEQDQTYIVRSSIVPRTKTESFASEISGAFESYVCKGSDIKESIIHVYASVFTEKAYRQIKLFSQESNIEGMGVIVQKYVPALYSGVIHVEDSKSIQIQWLEGHLSKIVSGESFGFSSYIYLDSLNAPVFRGTEKEILLLRDKSLQNIFVSIFQIACQIYMLYERSLELEWIFDGSKHWIVQCQELIE